MGTLDGRFREIRKNETLLLKNGFMDEMNSFRDHIINGMMWVAV